MKILDDYASKVAEANKPSILHIYILRNSILLSYIEKIDKNVLSIYLPKSVTFKITDKWKKNFCFSQKKIFCLEFSYWSLRI